MNANELMVGVDEFTVVLFSKTQVNVLDWPAHAQTIITEFIEKSQIGSLLGDLERSDNTSFPGYNIVYKVSGCVGMLICAYHDYHMQMGIGIQFSARVWAEYQTNYYRVNNQKTNVAVFLQTISSNKYTARLSRIDLTADYFNCDIVLDEMLERLKTNKLFCVSYRGRRIDISDSWLGKKGRVGTIYLGSRKGNSKAYLRIYDKKTEQIEKNGFLLELARSCKNWVRFEAIFRHEYAGQITNQLLDINTEKDLQRCIAGWILDKYRFTEHYDNEHTAFEPYTEQLLAIMGKDYDTVHLSANSPRDNDLYQSIRYLVKESGLISTMHKVGGVFGDEMIPAFLGFVLDYYLHHQVEYDRKIEMRRWIDRHAPGYAGIAFPELLEEIEEMLDNF